MIASLVYKRVSYRAWQYLHVLNYILFFFALFHANKWGSDSYTWYMKTIYLVFLLAVLIGLIYRTTYKLRKRFGTKFFLKNLNWETKDTFTLSLKSEKKLKFKAGQFCFLRLDKNNLHARHPFTMSGAPGEDDLRFTIKTAGRFTKTASELKPGEEIAVDGPFGKFTIKEKTKDLVFVAGGVGITPFMSMIRDQINKKQTQNISLFYACRTEEEIIFKKELDAIEDGWFKKVYILSREKTTSSANCECGYIRRELMEKYAKNMPNSLFYICGPEGMKTAVKNILKELKISKKAIISESFFW